MLRTLSFLSLYQCVCVLVEKYRERKQRNRKQNKRPSQCNDAASLPVGSTASNCKDTRKFAQSF